MVETEAAVIPNVVGDVPLVGQEKAPFLTLRFYKDGGFSSEFSEDKTAYPDSSTELLACVGSGGIALSGLRGWAMGLLKQARVAEAMVKEGLRRASTRGVH